MRLRRGLELLHHVVVQVANEQIGQAVLRLSWYQTDTGRATGLGKHIFDKPTLITQSPFDPPLDAPGEVLNLRGRPRRVDTQAVALHSLEDFAAKVFRTACRKIASTKNLKDPGTVKDELSRGAKAP